MIPGQVVLCAETGRVGLVVEIHQMPTKTLLLVSWPNAQHWVDAAEVNYVNGSSG